MMKLTQKIKTPNCECDECEIVMVAQIVILLFADADFESMST